MKKRLLLALALACMLPMPAFAGQTHNFITGPFKNALEVTKTCRECHERLTQAFMSTVHWTWTRKQTVNGKTMEYGKKNAVSNFYIALPSNYDGCTTCHPSYGWTEANFDFSKAENIDCLICHDSTGTYKKFPASGGHPVYPGETKESPPGKAWEPVDLARVARSVKRPPKAACGNCHFYCGGGDNVKHGDLDSTLGNPTPDQDVHMGAKGMTCESCHRAPSHDIRGEALSVSPGSGVRPLACADCHKGKNIHKGQALNNHLGRVACQSCHIPAIARTTPTVVSWDWSTAGKDLKSEEPNKDAAKDANKDAKKEATVGKVYDKAKGEQVLAKDVIPTYLWYNGTVERVFLGDKIDPGQVVKLSAPRGDRSDPNSRIFPFKVMKGKQPYDVENRTVAVANLSGPADSDSAYWVKYDWNKAIAAGMKAAGQPYSGKYGWVETSMVWSLNHTISPKEKALRCHDCHGDKGRIDWKSLGYPKDPR